MVTSVFMLVAFLFWACIAAALLLFLLFFVNILYGMIKAFITIIRGDIKK